LSFKLTLIVPGDPAQRTGGYLYDARIVGELKAQGWSVEVIGLDGRFPIVDSKAREHMNQTLENLPDGARLVIDGLALGGLPEVIQAHANRLDMTALVHHPLADETGLSETLQSQLQTSEREALDNCRRVIVTSPFTARRLDELDFCRHDPVVIEPGVDPAELAQAVTRRLQGLETDPAENLLCVASLTPRKAQDLLVQALSRIPDRQWHCALAGSDQRDPEYASQVKDLIREYGLEERVELTGELDERQLQVRYHQASLCVLPSHYEGYGMVVTEALARGLPLVATTGGALADTVPDQAALKIHPGDVEALHAALRSWLDDPALRQRLTRQAVAARDQLSGWSETGKRFAHALIS
jgi:glycosyltransferase involved in cell wall biosynthesis